MSFTSAVSSGMTITGEIISGGTQTIYNGGVANSTTVNAGGFQYVSSGGTVNDSIIQSNGYLYVLSGGEAYDANVIGKMIVYSSATAHSTIISSSGHVNLYSGGSMSYVMQNAGGAINTNTDATIISGTNTRSDGYHSFSLINGVAVNFLFEHGGGLYVENTHIASNTLLNDDGYLTVRSGGTATNTVINSGGGLNILSGASANIIYQNDDSKIRTNTGAIITNGVNTRTDGHSSFSIIDGVASNFLLFNDGALEINNGDSAYNTIINSGGTQSISSGGIAYDTEVNSNGILIISSGAVVSNVIQQSGGNISVDTGATILNGTNYRTDGHSSFSIINGIASNFIVDSSFFYVSDGHSAIDTLVNSGSMTVLNGGSATVTTINSGGSMTIFGDGTATDTTINSGGSQILSSGGIANSTTVNSGGRLNVYSGTASIITINSGALMDLNSYSTANTVTINSGGSIKGYYGSLLNNVTINSGGSLNIDPSGVSRYCGSANVVTQNSGGIIIAQTYSELLNGTNNRTDGFNNFSISNHIASNLLLENGGKLKVGTTGHYAINTIIASGGTLYVSSGGVASSTTIESGGVQSIYMGGTASIINQCSGGILQVHIGATITGGTNTRMDGHSSFSIISGVASNFLLESGSTLDVSSGYSAIDTMINYNGYQKVCGDATVSNTIINNGGIQRLDGDDDNPDSIGIAYNTTINYGGRQIVYSGGITHDATVNSGGVLQFYDKDGIFTGNLTVNGGIVTSLYSNINIIDSNAQLNLSAGADISSSVFTLSNGASVNIQGVENDIGHITIIDTGVLDFQISYLEAPTRAAMITDWSSVSTSNINITLDSVVNGIGSYALAGNASTFSGNITVYDGLAEIGEVSLDNVIILEDYTSYSLSMNNNTLTFNISAADDTAPDVPENLTCLIEQTNASLNWDDASDDLSGIKEYVVQYADNADFSDATSQNVTDNELDLSSLTAGGYYWHVKAVDNSGNESDWSATGTFEIDLPYTPVVSSGMAVSDETVAHGTQTILNGGQTTSNIIDDSGVQIVSSGGVADQTVIEDEGTQSIYMGGIANSTHLCNGAYQNVYSGGSAVSTLVEDVCSQTIYSGGVVSDTTLGYYGRQYIYSGYAYNTIINSRGVQYVFGGGSAKLSLIYSDGIQEVSSGANVTDTTIYSGGSQILYYGANVSHTTISSGASQHVNGVSVSASILYGGTQVVSSSGVASGAILDGTSSFATTYARQMVIGGSAIDTVINAPNTSDANHAVQYIASGGEATNTTVNGFGVVVVQQTGSANIVTMYGGRNIVHGSARNTAIFSGAVQSVTSAGIVNSTSIYTGGLLVVSSGGQLTGLLAVDGGSVKTDDVVNMTEAGDHIHLRGEADLSEAALSLSGGGDLTVSGINNDAGNISITGDGALIFDISEFSSISPIVMLTDLTDVSVSAYSLNLDSAVQNSTGNYLIAGNASDFDGTITVFDGETEVGTVSLTDSIMTDAFTGYSISINDGILSFDIYVDNIGPDKPDNLSSNTNFINVGLDWDNAADNFSGVKEYIVEYANNSEFAGALSHVVTDSNSGLFNLDEGVYYWHVKAVDNMNNQSVWSDTESFSIDVSAPDVPSGLISSVVNTAASLDWVDSNDNVSGIRNYVIQYADNAQFSGASSQTLKNSELNLVGLSDLTTYYWRVKAIDNNNYESDWSVTDSFTIDIPDSQAPDVPSSLSSTIMDDSADLDWSDSGDNKSGLKEYVVEYADNREFSDALSQVVTNSEVTLSDLTDMTTYYWRVKAIDNAGNESDWVASSFAVNIEDDVPPDTPAGLTETVTGNYIVLDWADSTDNKSGLKEYIVEYADNIIFAESSSIVTGDSDFELDSLTDGIYYWRVKAIDNNDNASDWSSTDSFTVDISAPELPATLNAVVTQDDVALDWADSSDNLTGLNRYTVEYTKTDFNAANSAISTSSKLDLSNLADGIYHWRVKADDNNGNETAWINGDDFIVDTTASSKPSDLNNSVTANSVALDWSDSVDNISGLKEYVVEYAQNSELSNAVSSIVTSSEFALSSLADNIYYWRVKSVDNAGNESDWSSVDTFVVDVTAPDIPASLTFSVDGNTATLDWADSTDNLTGLSGYIVAYGLSSDFSDATIVNADSSDIDLDNLADGIYSWRIRAVDNNDNASAWNIGNLITIDTTAPDIPEGLVDSVSGSNASLDWSDSTDNITGVKEYIVEYADNADFTDSEIASSQTSNLDINNLADGTWYWRTKSVDNTDNESDWSAVSSFDVDTTAPSIPTGLVENMNNGTVVLEWIASTDDLSGIAGYVIEYAASSNFADSFSAQTAVGELELNNLSYGTWFWRVKAGDSFGNWSEWSASESFDTGDTSGDSYDSANDISVDDEFSYNEYVGQGDPCDMYCFDVATPGEFDLALTNLSAKTKVTVYTWNGKKYKKLKGANSKLDKETGLLEAHIDNLLLDEGTFYVEVISGDKGKGKYNTDYSLDITPSYFPEVTNNNTWQDATEIVPDIQLNGFVGFGDACDYYKFEVENLTAFDFDMIGEDKNARLTVYMWDDRKDKLKKVKNAKLKYGEASIDNLNLDAGLYYVEVLSADKGKGKKNTEYELDITAV